MLFFHLTRPLYVASTGRFPHQIVFALSVLQLQSPAELVPVDATALVSHSFSFCDFLRGLPPSLPFSREDSAFRLDLAAPRLRHLTAFRRNATLMPM